MTPLEIHENVLAGSSSVTDSSPEVPEISTENPSRSQSIRYVRIGIAVFAIALALIIVSPSMVHTAHASTLSPLQPPYPTSAACYDNYGLVAGCNLIEANDSSPCATQVCAYTTENPNAVTSSLYLSEGGGNGNLNLAFDTAAFPCPSYASGNNQCPYPQGLVYANCCTVNVYADVAFYGELIGTGYTSNGFGGAGMSLDWNIYGRHNYQYCDPHTYQCSTQFYWTYLTTVYDICAVQGDATGNPHFCKSPYTPQGATGFCNGTAQSDCIMDSGTILREFNTLSLPSGYPEYAISFSFQLYADSTQGTDGYASDNFWNPGVFYLYDFGAVNLSPPNPPTLGFPGNNGAAHSPVDFQWTPTYDDTGIDHYTIQISTDPSFTNVLNCVQYGPSCWPSGSSTDFSWSLPTEGTYYWRMNEVVGGSGTWLGPGPTIPFEASGWSPTYTFIVDNTPPGAVALTGPPSGTITNNKQPTISWNAATDYGHPASGIAGYVLEWDTSSAFSTTDPNFHSYPAYPLVYIPTSGTFNSPLADGTWYWRVAAVDNAGNLGPWSTAWSIIIDTIPPSTPTLQSPSNGAVSTSTTQTLSWSAATDNIGVASYNIQIDTSTSFNSPNKISPTGITGTSYSVTLRPGTWYWEVQAVDKAGNKGSWSSYFTLNIADFTISASPNPLATSPGTAAAWTISVGSLYGFSGPVTLTDTVPAGLTCSAISPASVSPSPTNTPITATLSCSTNTVGNYQVTITGTSNSIPHSTSVTFQATGALSISANPTVVPSDGTSSSTITIQTSNSQALVTVTISTTLGTRSATSCQTGSTGSCTITLTSTTPGTATITASAPFYSSATTTVTFGTITLTASLTSVPADFATTSTLTAQLSSSVQGVTISFAITASTGGAGTLSALSCTTSSTGSCAVTIKSLFYGVATVTASNAAYVSGQTSVTFYDFTIAVSPTTVTTIVGSTTTATITITSQQGFSGTVSLGSIVTQDPTGLSCSVSPLSATVGPSTPATATMSCTAQKPGGYTASALGQFSTGQNTGMSHSAQISYTVQDFSITQVGPQNVIPVTANIPVTVTSLNGYSGSVTLSTCCIMDTLNPGGSGSGITFSFSPATFTLTPNAATTVTMTVTIAQNINVESDDYILEILATSNGVTRYHAYHVFPADFFPTANPSSVTLQSGATTTSTISISDIRFYYTASLYTSSSNYFLNANLNPWTLNLVGGCCNTTTLTISALNVPAGSYSITVTIQTSVLTHTVTIPVQVTDFSVSTSPSSTTITAGRSGSVTVSVASLNGFTGTVSLTTVGLPSCATATFSPSSLSLTSGSTLTSTITLTLGSSCAASTVNFQVQGTSAPTVHTAPVTLTISDFSISISPPTIGIWFKNAAQVTVTGTSLNGYTGTVTLTAQNLPTCLSSSNFMFNPTTITIPSAGSATSTLTLSFGGCGTTIETVTIQGSDGYISRASPFTIGYGTFVISASPNPIIGNPGTTATTTVTVSQIVGGYSATATMTATANAPSSCGTPQLNPTTISLPSGGTTTLSMSLGASCPRGTYQITVSGTTGKISSTATFTLVTTDYSLSANPNSITMLQYSCWPSTITVTGLSGFTGPVTLSVSSPLAASFTGCGGTTSPVTVSVGASGTATATLTFDSCSAAVGTYSATITGNSNGLIHTIPMTVTVNTYNSSCGGGGGGSLAYGTLITMADGSSVAVQNLKVGDQMLGYNPAPGQYTVSTVLSIKIVDAPTMLVINTGTGIPLRVDASPTEILWTKLPDGTTLWLPVTELNVGDFLFTPSGWVPVISIASITGGHHIMYDITATDPYFANNYLDPALPS